MRSFSLSWLTRSFRPSLTRGSFFGSFIEPETSIRKTRVETGRLAMASSRPWSATRARRWALFQGQAAISTLALKGSLESLAGAWEGVWGKELTSSSRGQGGGGGG